MLERETAGIEITKMHRGVSTFITMLKYWIVGGL
jgi:hypothetical protein